MAKPSEKLFRLLYDAKLKRPGCALLQVAAGCNPYDLWLFFDPAKDWLTAPTPDMKIMHGTKAQWEIAAKYAPSAKSPQTLGV